MVFPSVTLADMANTVSPVSGVAQVKLTNVPPLTFLESGVSDSIISPWVSVL